MNKERKFELGQVWQTSSGTLWHVEKIHPTGQTSLRLGGCGRRAYQDKPPRLWKLYKAQ